MLCYALIMMPAFFAKAKAQRSTACRKGDGQRDQRVIIRRARDGGGRLRCCRGGCRGRGLHRRRLGGCCRGGCRRCRAGGRRRRHDRSRCRGLLLFVGHGNRERVDRFFVDQQLAVVGNLEHDIGCDFIALGRFGFAQGVGTGGQAQFMCRADRGPFLDDRIVLLHSQLCTGQVSIQIIRAYFADGDFCFCRCRGCRRNNNSGVNHLDGFDRIVADLESAVFVDCKGDIFRFVVPSGGICLVQNVGALGQTDGMGSFRSRPAVQPRCVGLVPNLHLCTGQSSVGIRCDLADGHFGHAGVLHHNRFRFNAANHPLFDKLLDGYEKALRFCLKVKALPLGLAIALLVLSVWRITTMGIVMIPEMGSNQLSITVDVADDMPKEDAFATADAVMDAVSAIDGVETVGAMSGGNSMVSMMGSDAAVDNTSFTYYVLLTDAGACRGSEIQQEIADATASLPCEVSVNANGMMDMSALSGSGIEVDLYGNDLDDLNTAASQVVDLLNGVDGIANASDGQENGDEEIHISIDKDKAMRMGLTVAQVYQQVAAKLTTDTTATTLKANGTNYTVTIVDKTETPDLDSLFNLEFETTTTDDDGNSVTETHTLGEFATRTTSAGFVSIARENGSRKMSVTSETADGYNTTLLSREVEPKLAALDLPDGVTAELAGETTQVAEMLQQMVLMMALALIFVYFVMVAQFQSLLSPFIVLFTIPLAFTGGMLGLMLAGEQLSLISLMGFLVLMGVVVNNGIVFVDYANQLRIGGLERTDALVATGRTRMRPILMTTLTTVLAMITMLFSQDVGSDMSKGMAIVIIGGLTYATLMTLFIVPVMYDLFYRKPPVNIDVGDDGMDDLPDDAAEFAAEFAARRAGTPQPADTAPAEPESFETTLLPPKEDAE